MADIHKVEGESQPKVVARRRMARYVHMDLVCCSLFRSCSNVRFVKLSHYLGIVLSVGSSSLICLSSQQHSTLCKMGSVLESVVLKWVQQCCVLLSFKRRIPQQILDLRWNQELTQLGLAIAAVKRMALRHHLLLSFLRIHLVSYKTILPF